MQIVNSTTSDLPIIFELYDAAIAHQKQVSHLHWLPFDRDMVVREIAEQRQWKVLVDGQVAAVFVTALADPDIWGGDAEPAVYLHRIVTHPDFRGRNMVQHITHWAAGHGKAQDIRYVRLDTWAENLKLKAIYEAAGFRFLGIAPPANPAGLPSHYSGISLAYFEMDIP